MSENIKIQNTTGLGLGLGYPIKTGPFMTKYEQTRILGLRALQIMQGCKILVPINEETDSLRIARLELRARVIPMIIRRTLPDNTYEDVHVNNLIVR